MFLLVYKAPGWTLALRFSSECGVNLYNTWINDAGLNEDDLTLRTFSATPPGMVSHRGHNCISSALTILDSALTS